ncbi:MAG: DNA mismatch repair endonuclease MutL [Lactobacillales bacterium]|jgi:DNA mismatch repair protein MutL|nr:DNA mismatch repair endonuclease MutL [Lactobacillales bacterium]
MNIRLLPQNLINQIAAGEVVERPASALKELMENAIDAGAAKIDVTFIDGGKTYFSVSDDGKGMTRDELQLAIRRHATSKLPGDDLFHICFLGFRGEALPSIGSVSKLKITSRPRGQSEAWTISIKGGHDETIEPAAHGFGTTVEVRDLFYTTPARLKFLKADQTELNYAKDVVDRLAMAYPGISFSLSTDKRTILNYPKTQSLIDRVHAVIGKGFKENALAVKTEYEGISLMGFVGLPTYTRSTSMAQYLFVNGRFIRDKVLSGAIRGAFQGLMGHDSFPVLALFLSVPMTDVDVNVHPAKTEVRFKEAARVRGMMVASIRNTLAEHGHKTSSTIGMQALEKAAEQTFVPYTPTFRSNLRPPADGKTFSAPPASSEIQPIHQPAPDYAFHSVKTVSPADMTPPMADEEFPPLGLAKAQLHKTYIISQTPDSIIITDQHAAHERLTYEKLNVKQNNPQTQLLLIPEMIDLKPDEVDVLVTRAPELKEFGLVLDAFGVDTIAVREIPALLDKADMKKLIQDLVDTIKEYDDTVLLKDKIKDIYARMSCHGSIRAGRVLTHAEMNALLREMESCGTSGQCIHGRPTYIELKLNDIERLFGRKK